MIESRSLYAMRNETRVGAMSTTKLSGWRAISDFMCRPGQLVAIRQGSRWRTYENAVVDNFEDRS